MKKTVWWLPVFFAMAYLQGCELALIGAGGAAAYTAFEDRRSSGMQIDDEAIELRVVNRITERFADTTHVNVTSYNRSVLLTGEVPDQRTRDDIEKIAVAVPNVRGVTNDLQIGKIAPETSRINDSFITGKIKARFLDAKRFNAVHVKVVTEAGVVYLLGVVTEKEAHDAVEIARTTGGVRKVVKVFEYCKAGDDACRPRARPAAEKSKPAG